MNRPLIDRIVNALLYEGYILYPYRPAIKNRQRWTFGGLYPEAYCRMQNAGNASSIQTECLVRGGSKTTLTATVRFLHLTARRVEERIPSLVEWPAGKTPSFRSVEMLQVGDKVLHAWQEAEERETTLRETTLGELMARPLRDSFVFPGGRRAEFVCDPAGDIKGRLIREQQMVEGEIATTAVEAAAGLFRVTLRVRNRTPWNEADGGSRDAALLRSLASTHAILDVQDGEFISLLDPPDDCRQAAGTCKNIGVWPVLVGSEGRKDTMLASPITLYDYPQIAPESPGDFFDGTEIDEMLALRILTLTEEEKQAMAAVDERAHVLLKRMESLSQEQRLGLHGAIRTLRPVAGEAVHG